MAVRPTNAAEEQEVNIVVRFHCFHKIINLLKLEIMQIHCKVCGKDVTMETEFETRSPYRIINNHMCEAKRIKAKIKALESGIIL